jgi:hypothetical protein
MLFYQVAESVAETDKKEESISISTSRKNVVGKMVHHLSLFQTKEQL